jgi:antirestriction protein ArdC
MIAKMEEGTGSWIKSWSAPHGAPINFKSKKPYRGFNSFYLSYEMAERGYDAPYFLTFNQAKELGGSVKKGSKSLPIYFYKFVKKEEEDEETGEIKKKEFPILKMYRVFNIEDIEGIEYEVPELKTNDNARFKEAEEFVAATKADIRHGGNRAFYRPSSDFIKVPKIEHFTDSENYYATLLHELTHWTGHEKRLNRTGGKRFGDKDYAFEELVAELGSVFFCNHLGIAIENNQHPEYLQSWVKALKAEPQILWRAASEAQKAFDFTLALTQSNSSKHDVEIEEVA